MTERSGSAVSTTTVTSTAREPPTSPPSNTPSQGKPCVMYVITDKAWDSIFVIYVLYVHTLSNT